MRATIGFLALALTLWAPAASGQEAPSQPVADFELRDAFGKTHRLTDFLKQKAVVVAFLGVDCPLAKLYAPRLNQLADEYGPKGVGFVGIDANLQDSPTDIQRYVDLHAIRFPILKDVSNSIADRFGAQRTPEVFVLDRARRVRYRGRVDDQHGVGASRPQPTRNDLAQALEELLGDRPVSVPNTESVGCLIGRIESASAAGSVTYSRHVASILGRRCLRCHRPGEVAPFALTTYADVVGWSAMIREVLEEGRMPPWHADARYGKFANDPSPTMEEKQTIFEWIRHGCPEGDAADLPPPPQFPAGWSIPGPDLIVRMPEPFVVPATGTIEYQEIEIDPDFREDRWVRAIEIRPSNRAVVHHVSLYIRPVGAEAAVIYGQFGSHAFATAAAGTPPVLLSPGQAKIIPAGWRFLLVMHYQAIGSEQRDQTEIGLSFLNQEEVRQVVETKLLEDLQLRIPPGEANHEVLHSWDVPAHVDLLAMFPHMHLRGKSFRYEARYPGGATEILLSVPRFDFNWQHRYVLAEPKRLPAGTQIRCVAVYDNSAENPANPDPKAVVLSGKQSWEEMFNGYFDIVLADQDLTRRKPPYILLLAAALGMGWLGLRAARRSCCSTGPSPP